MGIREDIARNRGALPDAPAGLDGPSEVPAEHSLASFVRSRRGYAGEEPNALERALGSVFEKVPFLQEAFTFLGRPLFAIANAVEAGVLGVQGRGDEALGRLRAAARNIGSIVTDAPDILTLGLIDTPDLAKPSDLRTFKDVLTTAGVGDIFRAELPLIGEVTGKGILGLGIDVAFDPLRVTRLGAKIPGTGERALLSFRGRPVIKGNKVLDAIGSANKFLRGTVGKPFVLSKDPQVARMLDFQRGEAAVQGIRRAEAMQELSDAGIRAGEKIGLAPEIAEEHFLLGAERSLVRTGPARRQAISELRAEAALAERRLEVATRRGDQIKQFELSEKLKQLKAEEDAFFHPERTAKTPGFAAERAAGAAPERLQARAELKKAFDRFHRGGTSRAEALRAALVKTRFPTLSDEMAEYIGPWLAHFRDIYKNETMAGVAIAKLSDPWLAYVTRALRPEARDFAIRKNLMSRLEGRFTQWYAKHGSTKRRKAIFEGSPIPELNAIFADAGFTGKAFETNPAMLAAVRARREGFAVSSATGLKRVIEHFGDELTDANRAAGYISVREIMDKTGLRPYMRKGGGDASLMVRSRVKELADGGIELRAAEQQAIKELVDAGEIVPTQLGGLENMALPPDVAKDFANVWKAWHSVETPGRLLHLFDKTTQIWKTGVTQFFPEFHARNWLSNVYANYLGDVVSPSSYSDGFSILRDWIKRRNPERVVVTLADGSKLTSHEIHTLMQGHRLRGFGGTSHVELGAGKRLAERVPLLKYGPKTGEFIEDWAKVTHFIDKLRKGYSVEEAAFSVKKFLFDYSDLTPFEKRVMRRVVPFYTWMRKNTPLQIESILTKPGKASRVAHFQRFLQNAGTEENGPIDKTVIPEWIRRRIYGTSRDPDTGDIRILSGFGIGLEDLAIFDRPSADFLASLNPLLKAPLQAITNRDFFRDVPLERAEIAPTALRYFEYVPGGKAFLDSIGFRMVKDSDGNERWARANPRFLNALRGVPLLAATSRAQTTLSQAARAIGGEQGPFTPNFPLKALTGIRASESDPQAQMREHMKSMLQAYVDRLEELQREGVTDKLDVYFIERDIAQEDPRRTEAKALIRDLARMKKQLGELSRVGVTATQRASLRSGGRE